MEKEVVVSDTSCFIILYKIDALELLQKIFSNVYTTPEVAAEFKKALPQWVIIKSASNQRLQTELEIELGKGESSAIALATELIDCTILLDDLDGRIAALKLGLHVGGTLGLLIRAKFLGVIPAILPLINRIRQTNFHYSERLLNDALQQAGE